MAKTNNIIPVKTGDRLELTIETQGASGDGICRHEGYTLFVPGGLPGDHVMGEISKITPRFGVVLSCAAQLARTTPRSEVLCGSPASGAHFSGQARAQSSSPPVSGPALSRPTGAVNADGGAERGDAGRIA